MAKAGYSVATTAAVSLTAATAKSILGIRGNAAFGVDLTGVSVGFAGVTATEVPVLVELFGCTFGTNPPGTNSTSRTPIQLYGRVLTHGFTAGSNWTTEPGTLTSQALDEMLLTPNGGLVKWAWPLGQSPDSAFSEGFVVRCTAPSATTVRATFTFERC